jgi:hypothetical protein
MAIYGDCTGDIYTYIGDLNQEGEPHGIGWAIEYNG